MVTGYNIFFSPLDADVSGQNLPKYWLVKKKPTRTLVIGPWVCSVCGDNSANQLALWWAAGLQVWKLERAWLAQELCCIHSPHSQSLQTSGSALPSWWSLDFLYHQAARLQKTKLEVRGTNCPDLSGTAHWRSPISGNPLVQGNHRILSRPEKSLPLIWETCYTWSTSDFGPRGHMAVPVGQKRRFCNPVNTSR
jgi:hypothetical protein